MSIASYLYENSPFFLQNLLCSLKGFIIKRRRYNKNFYEELYRYEHEFYKTEDELRKILKVALTIPAYKVAAQTAIRNEDIYEALKIFPIIGKQDVKARIEEFRNENYQGKVFSMKTSGTTGSGMVFPYSVEMENKQWAVWWRYRKSLGIDLNTWCGWLGGRTIIPLSNQRPPYWRLNKPGRQVMYSAHHLSVQTIKEYHADIERRQLTWLHGYPSSASMLASLIIEAGLKPIESVRWITTGAENLLDHHVETIKRAFPYAMVRTHYGLSEGVANFSQTKEGLWRIDDDFAYVEFIPLDETDKSVCRIIGTGFSNLAFPLIRYDTGDLAKVNWVDGIPEIVEIYGRQEDYIELPNGVKLGRLDHIFKNCVNIREAQIHQIRKDLIELRVVKDVNYNENDENLLLREACSRFGKDVELIINYCDGIERTRSGKVKFIVTELKDE